MSDNTLNKALGIMGCDSPWRRRLRARLTLDRVDLAQRVGAFDDDGSGSLTRPRNGEKTPRRDKVVRVSLARATRTRSRIYSRALLARTRAFNAAFV